MSEDLRKQVYQALLARSNNGILHKKDTQIIADRFDLHLRTVQRIWRRGKTQLANSVPVVVSSLKKGRVGRKTMPIDLETLRDIPLKERMTIQDVCAKLNISKWKVQRYLRRGLLRRHSSSIKPYLTEGNKKTRLKWCIDMIERGLSGDPRFKFFFTLSSLMKNGSTSPKNLKSITCSPKKTIHIGLVRTKTTSLGSCFCVFVLGRGLEMGSAFFMVELDVFLLSLMNRLKEVMQ